MRFSVLRLQKAINNREFIPFYQAICRSDTAEVVGCEVLARWRHPERGLLQADAFINSFESMGIEGTLMKSLTDEVLTDIQHLLPEHCRPFLMTLNVSPGLFMTPKSRDILLALNRQLKQTGVTPVFEITEREDIRDHPNAEEVFNEMVGSGLKFAVDDYGTGYANNELVNITKATFIKIDRHLTADLANPGSIRFIDTVVQQARQTETRVIAEGVETPVQATALRELGVDFLQGYHCGTPMPARLFYYHLAAQPVPIIS